MTYYSNLIGFELDDGTLKNYNLSKSTEFAGLKAGKVKYVYFGGYPSSLVSSETTIKNLNSVTFDSKTSVADYGGTKYMKVDFMQGSTQTATLYYRYAPIKWDVLFSSKNELVLISDQVIDFYDYDGLSSWLKSVFKPAAFSGTERKIINVDAHILSVDDVSKYSSKLVMKTTTTDYATMRKNFGKNLCCFHNIFLSFTINSIVVSVSQNFVIYFSKFFF